MLNYHQSRQKKRTFIGRIKSMFLSIDNAIDKLSFKSIIIAFVTVFALNAFIFIQYPRIDQQHDNDRKLQMQHPLQQQLAVLQQHPLQQLLPLQPQLLLVDELPAAQPTQPAVSFHDIIARFYKEKTIDNARAVVEEKDDRAEFKFTYKQAISEARQIIAAFEHAMSTSPSTAELVPTSQTGQPFVQTLQPFQQQAALQQLQLQLQQSAFVSPPQTGQQSAQKLQQPQANSSPQQLTLKFKYRIDWDPKDDSRTITLDNFDEEIRPNILAQFPSLNIHPFPDTPIKMVPDPVKHQKVSHLKGLLLGRAYSRLCGWYEDLLRPFYVHIGAIRKAIGNWPSHFGGDKFDGKFFEREITINF